MCRPERQVQVALKQNSPMTQMSNYFKNTAMSHPCVVAITKISLFCLGNQKNTSENNAAVNCRQRVFLYGEACQTVINLQLNILGFSKMKIFAIQVDVFVLIYFDFLYLYFNLETYIEHNVNSVLTSIIIIIFEAHQLWHPQQIIIKFKVKNKFILRVW